MSTTRHGAGSAGSTTTPATPTTPASGTGTGARAWRTVDIVVAAVIAVAFSVVFWAWNLLWVATGPAFAALPPLQGFMYGIWLLPGVLGMLVIRKPGAAVFTEFVAAAVSALLLGTPWGLTVVWYGLRQGLAPELVFAATRYRRFTLPVALVAGAAAGLVASALDRFYFYPTWTTGWTALYVGLVSASAAVIAGVGAWLLVRALAPTGALDPFPSGGERTAI